MMKYDKNVDEVRIIGKLHVTDLTDSFGGFIPVDFEPYRTRVYAVALPSREDVLIQDDYVLERADEYNYKPIGILETLLLTQTPKGVRVEADYEPVNPDDSRVEWAYKLIDRYHRERKEDAERFIDMLKRTKVDKSGRIIETRPE